MFTPPSERRPRSTLLAVVILGLGFTAGVLVLAQNTATASANRGLRQGPLIRGDVALAQQPQSLYERKILPEKKFGRNDLILILVEESGSASNNSTTNLRRKFDLRAEFASVNLKDFQLEPDKTALPSLDLTSEKKLEGRGTTDRRERITFKIMARVIDVRPNDNLILEGRTTRRINDEESILTIFGEVDPKDIDERIKAVRSERVADLKLVYSGRGPVSRNLGRSALSWMLEWLWPF